LDKSQNSDQADIVKANTPAVEAPTSPNNGDDAPPLTPAAWLSQNGIYIVLFGALIALILHYSGLNGLWRWTLVVLGLSFVVFIHELGHFLAAKWCDVHVQTFSIGFGPALPGCSFRYGETLYKLALLPLGGYVGMVGEGPEADENEDYPRSFKNKPVGQRMLIISAGVIMNVLFGCLAFVAVYRLHGIERTTAVIGGIEAGGPAWQSGIRSAETVTRIGNAENPYFEDLKVRVSLSAAGDALAFQTKKRAPEGRDFDGQITPRCDANDMSPVIGIVNAPQLVLVGPRAKSWRRLPVLYHSGAAAARVMDVDPGANVVEATDPDNPDKTTTVKDGWPEVAERLRELVDKPMLLRVRPKNGKAGAELHEIKIELGGFTWDDAIVGTTNPDQSSTYDPFLVEPLPLDDANTQKKTHDFFEYRRRMKLLAGKPIVLQVQRKGAPSDAKPLNLFVPPEYHRSLGLRMRMGEIAAVRGNSPAAAAGLQPGDVITHVTITAPKPVAKEAGTADVRAFADFDPCRLPFELNQFAAQRSGEKTVVLTVERPNPPGNVANGGDNPDDKHKASKEMTIGPMTWDDSWRYDEEFPSGSTAALSIAQLGIAYRVDSTIVEVKADSAADKAGLQPKDEIIAIAFRQSTEDPNVVKWHDWVKLEATRGEQKRFDRWAYIDYELQELDYPDVQLKIRRNGDVKTVPADLKTGALTAEEDPTWPQAEHALLFSLDKRLQKADSMWEALKFGVSRTGEFIVNIYQSLRSLATRRVSPDMVQGPVGIATTAFVVAEDPWEFLLFLGLISVNLAVVNFMPVPILDGGHMVFLIYEKLRGKPASEAIRTWATYGGLALILFLMAFVLYKEALLPFVKWMWR
jgi:membrane-associated protease RseP (regulator of RpoE activity)